MAKKFEKVYYVIQCLPGNKYTVASRVFTKKKADLVKGFVSMSTGCKTLITEFTREELLTLTK